MRALVVLAVLFGGMARLAAAAGLGPHIDEAASVLAATMVAERGLPLFPSGVPYFQGATLSYLAAPLVALGAGAHGDYFTLRLISVVAGTLAILATYALGRQVSGRPGVGAAAALLLAIDPVSIRWSGHLRMYALLELVAALALLAAARTLQDGPTRRRLAALVALVWLAIFTQIAAVLLLPAIGAMAAHRWRSALLRGRRDVTAALALCLAAPLGLAIVNRLAGAGRSPSTRQEAGGISFVGDHVLSLDTFTQPALTAWLDLFLDSAFGQVVPFAIVLCSGLVIGRVFLGHDDDASRAVGARTGAGLLLLVYWSSVLAIGLLTSAAEDRYLIHVLPAGCVLVAMALQAIVERVPVVRGGAPLRGGWLHPAAAVALVALLVAHAASGLRFLARYPDLHPNYAQAASYVEARREPGQPVYAAMTTAAYLELGADDLVFLPGAATSIRVANYVRADAAGTPVDYWIGVPSVFLLNDVCVALTTQPAAWVMVDDARLWADWAFSPDLRAVVEGLTYVQFIGEGYVTVRRPVPVAGRDPAAERICVRAARNAARGLDETMFDTDETP